MAACLGEMRMGLQDFAELTVSELRAVWRAWASARRDLERRAWERMRLSVCLTLQPFVSGRLTPHELLPLPWEEQPDAEPDRASAQTRREQRERFAYYRRHGVWPGG